MKSSFVHSIISGPDPACSCACVVLPMRSPSAFRKALLKLLRKKKKIIIKNALLRGICSSRDRLLLRKCQVDASYVSGG